jgi:hypothetical protein
MAMEHSPSDFPQYTETINCGIPEAFSKSFQTIGPDYPGN